MSWWLPIRCPLAELTDAGADLISDGQVTRTGVCMGWSMNPNLGTLWCPGGSECLRACPGNTGIQDKWPLHLTGGEMA